MDTPENDMTETLITLTSDIVAAHVSNNSVGVEDVPALIKNVHEALAGIGGSGSAEAARPDPAVSIRSSVKKDHVVCLEDGKKMKMLKRHLMTEHGMTPEEYRQRWNLPSDYPMVAPDYAETRRDLAKKIGLGRKPGQKVAPKAAAPAKKKAPAKKSASAKKSTPAKKAASKKSTPKKSAPAKKTTAAKSATKSLKKQSAKKAPQKAAEQS